MICGKGHMRMITYDNISDYCYIIILIYIFFKYYYYYDYYYYCDFYYYHYYYDYYYYYMAYNQILSYIIIVIACYCHCFFFFILLVMMRRTVPNPRFTANGKSAMGVIDGSRTWKPRQQYFQKIFRESLWVWCGQPPESYVCNINMGSRRFSKHQPQSDQIHRLDRLSMYWRRLFSQCWSIDILCLIPYLIFLIYYFVVWIIHLHLSSNTQINLTKNLWVLLPVSSFHQQIFQFWDDPTARCEIMGSQGASPQCLGSSLERHWRVSPSLPRNVVEATHISWENGQKMGIWFCNWIHFVGLFFFYPEDHNWSLPGPPT